MWAVTCSIRALPASIAALLLVAAMSMAPSSLAGPADNTPPPVTLDASLVLLGAFDYEPFAEGGTTSRCTDMVERAASRLRSRSVQFVPTHYWRTGVTGTISSYCWMQSGMVCRSWNPAAIAAFREGMVACFRAARDAGFSSIHIMPHLDSGDGGDWSIRTWRNGLVFGPRSRYGRYSYEDIMLVPLAEALATVLAEKPGAIKRVYFSLQGEMGATVMRYPEHWRQLMPAVTKLITGGLTQQAQGWGGAFMLKFGLTFNFIYSDGAQADSGNPARALATGLFGWWIGMQPGFGAPAFDADAVQRLLRQCGFIGVSAYAPLNSVDFPTTALQNSAFNMMDGFKSIGIDLDSIMRETKAELHYVEFGMGGGVSQAGKVPATLPSEAAMKPFWGVQGEYRRVNDPWAVPAMHSFRRTYYAKVLRWLQDGTGPTYRISAVFLWNKASWDVAGVHPEASSPEGTSADDQVVQMIQTHNLGVIMGTSTALRRSGQTGRTPPSKPGGGVLSGR